MEPTTAKLCGATTRAGAPCRTYALTGSAFCWWHDPTRAEDRKEARSRGGHARHGRSIGKVGDVAPVKIDSLADVLRLLTDEINTVRGLEVGISRARTIGYLAGIVASIYQAAEFEQRLAQVERDLQQRKAQISQ